MHALTMKPTELAANARNKNYTNKIIVTEEKIPQNTRKHNLKHLKHSENFSS